MITPCVLQLDHLHFHFESTAELLTDPRTRAILAEPPWVTFGEITPLPAEMDRDWQRRADEEEQRERAVSVPLLVHNTFRS